MLPRLERGIEISSNVLDFNETNFSKINAIRCHLVKQNHHETGKKHQSIPGKRIQMAWFRSLLQHDIGLAHPAVLRIGEVVVLDRLVVLEMLMDALRENPVAVSMDDGER